MADSVIKYSDLIGEDDTFDVIFDNIDKLRKELTDLAQDAKKGLDLVNPNDEKALKSAVEQVEKLAKAKKKLDTEEKKAVKTKKKLSDLTNKELILREKEKIANRERIQRLKQVAILTNKESGEIEKLRARLSLTTLAWKKLSKEELNNTQKGKALIATKLKLTNQLKKLEKQTGDTRRNVGNYTSSLGKLGKVAAGLFIGRNIISGIQRIGGALAGLVEKNKDSNESAKILSETFTRISSALESLGLFILDVVAGPLKSLIDGFEFLTKSLFGIDLSAKKASEGVRDLQNEFNAEIEVLKRGNLSTEARKQLIDDINKKYKDYLPNLIDEKDTLDDITTAQNQANTAFEKKILLLASEEQFVDITKRRLDALREQAKLEEIAFKATQKSTKASENFKTILAGNDKRLVNNAANKAINASRDAVDAKNALAANKEKLAQIEQEKIALDAVLKQQGINSEDFIKRREEETAAEEEAASSAKKVQKVYKDNIELRIAAIDALQDKINKSEADNIEDQTERLIRLEELKFQAIQEKREEDFTKFIALLEQQEENEIAFYGENSAEVIAFRKKAGEELLAVEANNLKLSELQLQESEDRKLKIIQDADKKRIDNATKIVKEAQKLRKKGQSDEEKFIEEQGKKAAKQAEGIQKGVEDEQKKTAEATKARTDELLTGIKDTTAKIGAAIVSTFEKQADAAGDLVKTQAAAVETQRDRAEKGLSNTLKFEQEQLAQREAERIRAEKKAKQAAEFVTLLNLVSAYAAGGDANALARGLVDFSLLKALEAGFEEGGYTGDNGTSEIAGVVHGKEFVVTADDVKRYGLAGKSGGDFGEAMSDYFYSPLQQNLYNGQADNFKKGMSGRPNDFARLEDEMRAMRRAFQAVHQNDFDILQMTDYFVDISKRVTSNRMTKVSKQRKRL